MEGFLFSLRFSVDLSVTKKNRTNTEVHRGFTEVH